MSRTHRSVRLAFALVLGACSPAATPDTDSARANAPVSSSPGDTLPGDSIAAPLARGACRSLPGTGRAASDAELRLPTTGEGILGLITQLRAPFGQVEGFRILVEQDSTRSAGTPKADVLVSGNTRVVERGGRPSTPMALRLCQEVRIFFDGPVAESFPVQARAGTIVIERSGEVAPPR